MLAIDTVAHMQYRIGDNNVTIRPMSAADEELEAEFVRGLSPNTKYNRFLGGVNILSSAMLKKLCDIDGKHVMAFVATITEKTKEKQIGVSRYAVGEGENEGEIAVTVADDWQHQGIGRLLMKPLIEYARNNGIKQLYAIGLTSNVAMQHLAKGFGMKTTQEPGEDYLLRCYLDI
jgi:GNAT superfamily N-acetyltransferase